MFKNIIIPFFITIVIVSILGKEKSFYYFGNNVKELYFFIMFIMFTLDFQKYFIKFLQLFPVDRLYIYNLYSVYKQRLQFAKFVI